MNYLYIALALVEAGQEVNEENMRRVLTALGVETNEAEMQFVAPALAVATRMTERKEVQSSLLRQLEALQQRLEALEASVAVVSERVATPEWRLPVPPAEEPTEDRIRPLGSVGAEVAQPGESAIGKDGRYVYGIGNKGVTVSLGPIGLEGCEVYTTPYEDVCAIVHDCPAKPYESDDDEAVKGWVLTHQKVLDVAAGRFDTVLPMGFDIIIQGDDGDDPEEVLKEWLKENYEGLREKIATIRGKQEFGIQILWDPKVIARQIAETSEEIQTLNEEMESMPKGTAYMYRQKLENALKQKMEEKGDEWYKDFFARIKECVDDIVIGRTKKIADDKQMLMNLSCLVRKDRVEDLGEELEGIEGMEGFSVRFTGPWPAYSFVTPGKV